MATLQVRDVPQALLENLRRAAALGHRSLSKQVLAALEQSLQESATPRERRRALLATIESDRANTGSLPDPATLIREDRER